MVNIQNAFVFEGATDDAHETTLTTVDPTADRTIRLPNASGTLALDGAIEVEDLAATAMLQHLKHGMIMTVNLQLQVE